MTTSHYLGLDAHTLADLEIFETSGGKSLFELCNFTRTAGGARALRQRMAHPLSSPAAIVAVQDSLRFISANREAFRRLPRDFVMDKVDHYAREVLPSVRQTNPVAFAFGVFDIWANNTRHYSSIAQGVYMACGFVAGLRRFLEDEALEHAEGEIAPLLTEMRSLLNDTALARVRNADIGAWPFRVLRWDQLFRRQEKAAMHRLVALVYQIETLVSLADATSRNGFVFPEIEEGALRVSADELVHPLIEAAVANPLSLDQRARVLFLTGPNMAGKTTYLRAVGVALYLAHLGMGVPASRFSFVPAQRLFSTITLADDLQSGISYFRAEALRAKAVAEAIANGERVIALMDEPFKGTNVKDALDASRAILSRFADKQDCLFLFSSHLIELRDEFSDNAAIACRYFEARESEEQLSFDYRLRDGISSQRLGMRVLQEEGVFDLLDGNGRAP